MYDVNEAYDVHEAYGAGLRDTRPGPEKGTDPVPGRVTRRFSRLAKTAEPTCTPDGCVTRPPEPAGECPAHMRVTGG